MADKNSTGVSKIIWPPEQTIVYEFREDLELEIPLVENTKGQREDR